MGRQPKKVTNSLQQKKAVYELVMHDPELSGENYTEDFMIGIFRTRTMAEETAAYYLQHVRGFCEYPCTCSITEKEIMDAQDEIPDEIFMVQGWDTNENMDERDRNRSDPHGRDHKKIWLTGRPVHWSIRRRSACNRWNL